MNELQIAFQKWSSLFPGKSKGMTQHKCMTSEKLVGLIFNIPKNYDGDCPCFGGTAYHTDIKKDEKSGEFIPVPRPDNEVCDRERAWRNYVRIRDSGRFTLYDYDNEVVVTKGKRVVCEYL